MLQCLLLDLRSLSEPCRIEAIVLIAGATMIVHILRHTVDQAPCRTFIRTNPFNETDPQYQSSKVMPLGQPTDDTTKLVNATIKGLKEIYRTGYRYKKSGVLLMALQPKETIQATLFDDPVEQAKSDGMMSVMDTINRKVGKGTLTIATSGITKRWAMRRESKSSNYTTEWDELPEAW